jgi:DNA-binding CsgD family transcriptional regulator
MSRPVGRLGQPSGDQRRRVRDDIIRVSARGLPARRLLADVAARLRRAVPYDGAYLATLDPTSLLFTGGVVDDLPAELCHQYYINELAEPDTLKFADLIRRRQPAASLVIDTSGHPERSRRFRSIFAGLGAADEMRVVFRAGGTAWGVADLMRAGRPFSAAEAAFAASLSSPVAQGLSAAARAHVHDLTTAPGMLVIGADGLIESATAEATAQLPRLYAQGLPSGQLRARQPPEPVHAVAVRARMARGHASVRSLVRCGDGEWLSLHASSFEGDADGRVAVMLSAPPPAELTPLLMHAYGLSTREREVTMLIADGVPTRQIATALALSEHTVRDYVKAVFDKVGVSSRGGLIAELFGDRYQRSVLGTDRISTG